MEKIDNKPIDIKFSIQRIYVKSSSFKVHNDPDVFTVKNWKPRLTPEWDVVVELIRDNCYEMLLKINLTITNQSKAIFNAAVHQSGIVQVEMPSGKASLGDVEKILKKNAVSLLAPYAETVLSSMLMQASLPARILTPIRFAMTQPDEILAQEISEQVS